MTIRAPPRARMVPNSPLLPTRSNQSDRYMGFKPDIRRLPKGYDRKGMGEWELALMGVIPFVFVEIGENIPDSTGDKKKRTIEQSGGVSKRQKGR